MYGVLCGDIIGSIFEDDIELSKSGPLFNKYSHFTDDTVLACAVADTLMNSNEINFKKVLVDKLRYYGNKYPKAGYGEKFAVWLTTDNPRPYRSYGNGCAVRSIPIAYTSKSLEETIKKAKESAIITHNHMEGVIGAEAMAVCVYLALDGCSKKQIRQYIEEHYYKLDMSLDKVKSFYKFNPTCPGSVPFAIMCFLESHSFQNAIRKAVSLGGDSDTLAAMAGSIAEAYYGIPDDMINEAFSYIPIELQNVFNDFYSLDIVRDKTNVVKERFRTRNL